MKEKYLMSAVVDPITGKFKGFIYGASLDDIKKIAVKENVHLYGVILSCKYNSSGDNVVTLK